MDQVASTSCWWQHFLLYSIDSNTPSSNCSYSYWSTLGWIYAQTDQSHYKSASFISILSSCCPAHVLLLCNRVDWILSVVVSVCFPLCFETSASKWQGCSLGICRSWIDFVGFWQISCHLGILLSNCMKSIRRFSSPSLSCVDWGFRLRPEALAAVVVLYFRWFAGLAGLCLLCRQLTSILFSHLCFFWAQATFYSRFA